ncbi:MAG: hypothetical protein NWF10_06725 [Candidatus Bathyarchaeota archaeon]|jgi:hypothetical protein|nr:hypothetical protein [Candidatus Bathyarchaeota archaeon]
MPLPSKWKVYLIIGVFLVSVITIIMANIQINSESLGENLLSEFVGLLVTLIFFSGLIAISDYFEYKDVNKKVRERLERIINPLVNEILDYAILPGHPVDQETYDEEIRAQINSKERIFSDPMRYFHFDGPGSWVFTDEEFYSPEVAKAFEPILASLSTLENIHLKYLDPKVHLSLINMQIELDNLIKEIRKPFNSNTEDLLTEIMKKILVEIKTLRENGINITFLRCVV